MSKPRFTEQQIASILEEHISGKTALELCRKYSVSDTTFYKWRTNAGLGTGRQKSAIEVLREENARLRSKLEEQTAQLIKLRKSPPNQSASIGN
ncbi:MAG: transposase [Pseudomonadota bacterium]